MDKIDSYELINSVHRVVIRRDVATRKRLILFISFYEKNGSIEPKYTYRVYNIHERIVSVGSHLHSAIKVYNNLINY